MADSGLISGLSNCGYDEEVTELRQRYGPHLNPHHLFAEREPALQFRRVTSERVLEHAPFFVYGLYCLM